MDKNRFVLSLLQLFLALTAFVVVSFAWFAISTQVSSNPIQFETSHEFINSYQIKLYTKDYTYLYVADEQEFYIYYDLTDDSIENPDFVSILDNFCELSICDTPGYGYHDNTYPFDGIFLGEYDPLIPLNNDDNYMILELYLTYDVTADTNLTLAANADSDLALESVFGLPANQDYYLSEVVNLQYLYETTSFQYWNPDPDTITDKTYDPNKDDFNNLKDNFIINGSYNLDFPAHSFYGTTDTYSTSLDFTGTVPLLATNTEIYIYFSFSYYETKINSIVSTAEPTLPTTGLDYIRLFQDVVLVIKDGGSL
ncbi:MAG: hypothetical protein RQ856_00580 [Candidatus Izemoplasmatales bacterium]|nr:hypothetical protein [Candidatus Izemoplasmatales bacterium]